MVNRNKSTFFYLLLAVVASVMVGMVLASRLDLTSQSSAQTAAPAVNSAPIIGPVTATTFREVANMVSPAVVNIRTESLQQARDLSDLFGDNDSPWSGALGLKGPRGAYGVNGRPRQIPTSPAYDHGDYLPPSKPIAPIPTNPPPLWEKSADFMIRAFRGENQDWPPR